MEELVVECGGARMALDVARKAEWRALSDGDRPDVSFLPMLERRRLTGLERAAMHVAWRACFGGEGGAAEDVSAMPVVFASRWGEIGVTYRLMRQMQSEGEMSPAAFSCSVHNAAPGAWSLFTRSHAPYTAIAARGRTWEMGLVEAGAQLAAGAERVLFVYAEEATPADYRQRFGEPEAARAVAMVLVRGRGPQCVGR